MIDDDLIQQHLELVKKAARWDWVEANAESYPCSDDPEDDDFNRLVWEFTTCKTRPLAAAVDRHISEEGQS
jgi:hypothetical protein